MEPNIFSTKVRGRAESLGLTMADLCRAMHTPSSRMTEWLDKGQAPRDPRRLLILARELKVPVEYLIDDAIPVGDVPGDDPSAAKVGDIIRAIGYEEAFRRLVAVPGPGRTFRRDWGEGSTVGNNSGGS